MFLCVECVGLSMVERHSEVCDSSDVVPYAEKFEDADARVNEGIFWCEECERELVLEEVETGEEVLVF